MKPDDATFGTFSGHSKVLAAVIVELEYEPVSALPANLIPPLNVIAHPDAKQFKQVRDGALRS